MIKLVILNHEPRDPGVEEMPVVIIGIGPPGVGKTAVLKSLTEKMDDTVYVCPADYIRNAKHNNVDVWKTARKKIREALQSGHSVVIDATNTGKKKRMALVAHCRGAGASEIIGVVFVAPPIEQIFKRIEERGGCIEEAKIRGMFKALRESPPTKAEGFDGLILYDTVRKKMVRKL